MIPDTVSHALVVIDPIRALEDAKQRKDIVASMMDKDILRPGIDYGSIPGTDKPTLLKPGAERLCAAFHLAPYFDTITSVEQWDTPEPLFFYRILCRLVHIESGLVVATGIGSCNSRESKYRWRWITEDKLPAGVDKSKLEAKNGTLREPAFAIEKAETSGKYGKPAAYWQAFKDAIDRGEAKSVSMPKRDGGTMQAWEIGGLTYRIPNDDVFSLVNTIDKMATKRALIAATLIGANASEFFTQDVEDLAGFGVTEDVVEGSFTVVKPEPEKPQISAEDAVAKLGQNGHNRIPDEPRPKWATPENLDALKDILAKNDIQWSEVPKLVEAISDPADWKQWEAWAASGKTAAQGLIGLRDAQLRNTPPATPKNAPKEPTDEQALFGTVFEVTGFETVSGGKDKVFYWLTTTVENARIMARGRHGLFDQVGYTDEVMKDWNVPGYKHTFTAHEHFNIEAVEKVDPATKEKFWQFSKIAEFPF